MRWIGNQVMFWGAGNLPIVFTQADPLPSRGGC